MPERPYQIASVNTRRRSKLLHGLLQCSPFDIIMVQEPWHGRINVARDDNDPTGVDVLGVTANNMWKCFLPELSPTDNCKVATYVRRDITARCFVRSRTDLSISSPSSLVVDILSDTDSLRLINIYHHTPDKRSHLQHITTYELDPLIPTLVAGDFNTHRPTWSLPEATTSPWASALEEWFEGNDLFLCSPPGVATWEGRPEQAPSVLDLLLLNSTAMQTDQFSDVTVSFPHSLGSDHAALFISWTPVTALPALPPSLLPGFALDDDLRETWCKSFTAIPSPIISSRDSLLTAAARLLSDIADTCRPLFAPRKTPDPRGVRWWSATCSAALAAVQSAPREERALASKAFGSILDKERRAWANEFLHYTTTNKLWEATRWRHGRRATRIPPLRRDDNSFAHEPTDISPMLTARFFPDVVQQVDRSHPDDPPPLPSREWPPFTSTEVSDALASTSNASAPGLSGINYKLLKWAFGCAPDRFTTLYNGCLKWECHPWVDAKVVPIPKPNKPDYAMPKAYRPISLLECCGKLLEKLIAKRVLHDLNTFNILPPSQFGSRDGHCAVDAALALAHTAQQGIHTGNPTAVILFDIQGFYDNIQRKRVVHLFKLMGFPPSVVGWVQSFLSNRSITLAFNGWQGTPFEVSVGSPQGSPLSSILSAIYTAPLLRTAQQWPDCSMHLYVDDGSIAASAPTHRSATTKTASRFEYVTQWLRSVGLRIDVDKTEYIVFYNPRRSTNLIGHPPSRIALRDATNGQFTVSRANSIRYLGIFFQYNLHWDLHVRTMTNRARSTIRALHILGNSIRGLDFANWRKVFHAIVLPVLTYGAPIWACDKPPKYLLKIAQVAQNDALRRMSGCFRTTPVDPLHHLLAILPLPLTLQKLCRSFSDRLKRLPPTHMLRTILSHNPAACWPAFQFTTPSSLIKLTPAVFPLYVAPSLVSEWSHPMVRSSIKNRPSEASRAYTRSLIQSHRGLRLLIQLIPSPNGPLGTFLLFSGHHPRATHSGSRYGASVLQALWLALLDGIRSVLTLPPARLLILIPNRAIAPDLLKLSKHRFLPFAAELTSSLEAFLTEAPPSHIVEILWFSTKWSNLPGRDTLTHLSEESRTSPPPPQDTPMSRRDEAYQEWATQYLPRPSFPAWISITPPNGNKVGPFVAGLLSCRSHRIFSAGLQITNRHCFDASYSHRFRPDSGDTTECPCTSEDPAAGGGPTRGRAYVDAGFDDPATGGGPTRGRAYVDAGSDNLAAGGRPTRGRAYVDAGFDDLMDMYLDPHSNPERLDPARTLPRPPSQPYRNTLNTVEHVLTACPLTASFRRACLHDLPLHTILSTEEGGRMLGEFLQFSQRLLRPLPPRPDPP